MEIQGLSNAQNTRYQHGVPRQAGLSSSGTKGLVSDQILQENDNSECVSSSTDGNNNKRASSSLLLLLPQNGSGSALRRKASDSAPSPGVQPNSVGLCHMNVLKDKEYVDLELPADFVKLKYGEEEGEDAVLQMAVPLFDSDEESYTTCEDPQGHLESAPKDKRSATEGNAQGGAGAENSKDIYVVLLGEGGKNGNEGVESNDSNESVHRSATNSSDLERSPDWSVTQNRGTKNKYESKPTRLDVLTNLKSSGGERNEIPTTAPRERSDANSTPGLESMELQESDELIKCGLKCRIPETTFSAEMAVRNNSSECVNDTANFASDGNNDELSDVPPETFSGTIMINNQSIIVTIENGVLTLAAPPDNYTLKEDGVVSLKEHLGVKENEDIVLLNYETGVKSVEKMARRDGSDSEDLTLTDSLPVQSSSVKHERSPCNHKSQKDQSEDEQHPSGLLSSAATSKKPGTGSFHCSQPGCVSVFDTRQKLKMHLVLHAEDQRPFKCTVEGCGWSFTTSYKLKRHLQSHDKQRPYTCNFENCGRRFTTVYNLKAHLRGHEQEEAFSCELCGERFHTATRLTNHQRTHFEPERPHKCDFPGCEKSFITFSALFSHNRTHFRETSHFTCTYPGCDKRYDKACRLKIHLRSHTGERPFVCDFESCGWTFTSKSKLLRHKRKHNDDRRFTCPKEGCGKSFTRAEHLKGHSITHLGTKPFECPIEGCNAKFSARSSLYIHSKKHRQDGACLRSQCPVAGCTKHFSSRSSLKSHMVKHHNLSPEVLNQLENTVSLTPSCELTSAAQTATVPGSVGTELTSLDLSCLLTSVSSGTSTVPMGPSPQAGPASYTMDMALVSSGILTIDTASAGSALGVAKSVDPLILTAGGDITAHVLEAGGGAGVLHQAALQLDDVQTVNPEALGALTTLAIQSTSVTEQLQALSSSSALISESPSSALTPSLTSSIASSLAPTLVSSLVPSLVSSAVPELLSPQVKVDIVGNEVPVGPLLSGVEVLSQSENKAMSQFVFSRHSASYSGQKEAELPSVNAHSFMESSGSARTDYRAIQLAKRKKQRVASAATSGSTPRKPKGIKHSTTGAVLASTSTRFAEGTTSTAGFTIRDPVTGAQYVQIQLLQDDPAADGDLAFQLTSQTSSTHSQLTVDLPVNILQEPSAMVDDDNGSDNSQFTGSTINLQDLE